jgi:hypothetical protein
MAAHCCLGEPASRRFARWLSAAAASVAPATLLVLLPKCPLCLAAWLTAMTGVGFSAAGAGWVRIALVLFAIAVLASIVRRGVFGRAVVHIRRLS